ncbi:MAG: hypothetical protein ABJN04_07375 [Hyphomicrobiales bacterium]
MFSKKTILAAPLAALMLTTASINLAHAQAGIFEVIHPDVTKGEIELEFLNGIGLNNVEDGDERSVHEFAIGYGITDYWKFTAAFEVANPRGGSAEVEAIELENLIILPFFGGGHDDEKKRDHDKEKGVEDDDDHHAPFTLGFYTALEIPTDGGISEGGIEFGPVWEAEIGKLEWVGNLFVEAPFSEGDPGIAYASQLILPINDSVGIGVENFGEFEGAFGSGGDDEHFAGPAVYFSHELSNGHVIEPRAAVLFNLSESPTNAVFSFNLEYKFGG